MYYLLPHNVTRQAGNMRAITQRHHEYLELALQGFSNKEISSRLIVSHQTTRNALSRAYHRAPELKQRVRLARLKRLHDERQRVPSLS